MWTKLHAAVLAVQRKQPVSHSREELYRAVQDLCMHKFSANLLRRLQEDVDSHVQELLAGLVGQTPDHGAFLALVMETWQDHCDQMMTIRSIFLYLDRTYVIHLSGSRSLWDIGLQSFRKQLLARPEPVRKEH